LRLASAGRICILWMSNAAQTSLVPGHQIVGTVEVTGRSRAAIRRGRSRWCPLARHTCNHCRYCLAVVKIFAIMLSTPATKLTAVMQESTVAEAQFASPFRGYPDLQAAPVMCWALVIALG